MRKRRRLTLLSGLLVIVAGVIIGKSFVSRLNQPTSGTITTSTPHSGQAEYNVNLTPKPKVGKYASFNYPAGMTLKNSATIATPGVEELVFTARDTTAWLLAIDVSMPRGGLLISDSGYADRLNSPSLYQESQVTINGQSVIIMTDKSAASFSKVAYLMHGPFLATVSLTGNDATGTTPLQTTLNMVLSSWIWL
jgi:hypothetical protein